MKKIISIICSLFLFVSTSAAASFSDVPESHQYYAAIESLKNLGIVNGHPDGSFKPGDPVIRSEALKMILQSAGVQSVESVSDSGFADVPASQWYAIYTARGKELGIVKGQGETGLFAPAQQVNKAEFLKMLLQSFETDLSKHQGFTEAISGDVTPGTWFIPYFSYAKSLGIIYPTLNGNLEPDRFLNRGECAEIIYKLLIIERGGDAQKMLNLTEAHLVDLLVDLSNNDIAGALNNANNAVFYSEKALDVAPDEGIVKAANKIANGFKSLCMAYKAGLDDDSELLISYANEAKQYANEAAVDDPSMLNLGEKIKEQADVLIRQAE